MNYSAIHSLLFIGTVLLDRITKSYALMYCASQEMIPGFLTCDLTFNRGMAWSIFSSSNQIVFYGITLVQIVITLLFATVVLPHIFKRIGWDTIGGMLIIAGSLGNIYDRFVYDGVVDFIHVSYSGYSFAIFNVADIAIVCGIFLFLWGIHDSARTS